MKQFIAILIFVFTIPLIAQPHAIDFTQPILAMDGQPVIGPDKKPLTLSSVTVDALIAELTGDKDMPLSKHLELYALAHKVLDNKQCVLTAEEVSTIEKRIGDAWPNTWVIGSSISMLDPNAVYVPSADAPATKSPAEKKK